jgi:NADH-quinone oxidoreductase subunit L
VTSSGYFLEHLWLIPLSPLLTAAFMLFFGRFLPRFAVGLICAASVLLALIYSAGSVCNLVALPGGQRVYQQILFEWVASGAMPASRTIVPFVADWGYLLDPLSCVMILVVTSVGFLVHVYSIGSMASQDGYYRFFGYLNLFMFAMLTLVLANNLLLLFVGWEGLSVCSYLLIGFYFERTSAEDAGKKAFLVNRIGDAGLLLAIFLIAATFGTVRFTSQWLDAVSYPGITETLAFMTEHGFLAVGAPILTTIALLIFVGAATKSVQLPIHIWLPEATESPVPATALIHAATMVAAGTYVVTRMNAIYQLAPVAMDVVAAVGALTAIFAATVAAAQHDIKKVLAYSTISQLGFLFLALGVGAFAAGVFHLMTHAFFMALLFLGAGSVMHALSGEQDIRKMGGIWKAMPVTSWTFLIATLAICAAPGFAGFFSLNEILGHAFVSPAETNPYLALWIVGVITVGLTAFYMFRLFFRAIFGPSQIPPEMQEPLLESPRTMTAPLLVLAGLSIIGGWIALPELWGDASPFETFLEPVLLRGVAPEATAAHFASPSLGMAWLSILASLTMAMAGYWFARKLYLKSPELREKVAGAWPRLQGLLLHEYRVEEVYDAIFVNRVKDLGTAIGWFDAKVIDGLAVGGFAWALRLFSRFSMWWDRWVVDGLINLAGKFPQLLSAPMRMFQTGVFSSYALFVLLGLAILLGYYGHHMQVWVRSLH